MEIRPIRHIAAETDKDQPSVSIVNVFRANAKKDLPEQDLDNITAVDLENLAYANDKKINQLLDMCLPYNEKLDEIMKKWSAEEEKRKGKVSGDILEPLKYINEQRKAKELTEISQWDYIRIILTDRENFKIVNSWEPRPHIRKGIA